MKKIRIVCLMLVGVFCFLKTEAQVKIGIRAGVNLAKYEFNFKDLPTTGTLSVKNNFAPVFLFSVPIEINMGKHFALQPELSFIQRGFNYTQSHSTTNVYRYLELDGKLNCLELPIMGKIKFGEAFRVVFGPSFGYALTGKTTEIERYQAAFNSTNSTETYNINFEKDGHKRFDIGLNLGGEICLRGFFIDARYQLGVIDMITDADADGASAFNRGILLTLGYRF